MNKPVFEKYSQCKPKICALKKEVKTELNGIAEAHGHHGVVDKNVQDLSQCDDNNKEHFAACLYILHTFYIEGSSNTNGQLSVPIPIYQSLFINAT